MTAVTPAPSNTALIGVDVSFSKICSSLPPEVFARPSPITSIPYRNRASPPTIVNKSKKSISSPLKFTYFTIFLHYQSHCRWGL